MLKMINRISKMGGEYYIPSRIITSRADDRAEYSLPAQGRIYPLPGGRWFIKEYTGGEATWVDIPPGERRYFLEGMMWGGGRVFHP